MKEQFQGLLILIIVIVSLFLLYYCESMQKLDCQMACGLNEFYFDDKSYRNHKCYCRINQTWEEIKDF